MGNFRFYRRISIFPGLSVNVSKSGPSLTVGMRGAHVTVGGNGIRRTVGIPAPASTIRRTADTILVPIRRTSISRSPTVSKRRRTGLRNLSPYFASSASSHSR
jgi:hypothetical protein